MRFDENPIWKQIENFRFDFENYNGKFPEKLARTGNWDPDFTREVVEGYLIFPVPINGIPIKIKEAKIMLPLFIITGIVGLHLQSVWGVFGFWGAIAGSTIINRLINSFFGVKTKHPSPKDGMGYPVYE